MERPLSGKHIVLGISGGIAAYKSAVLLRLLIKSGAEVQVVITPNGKEFITPATLAALSGKPVVSEFFAANTGEWHSHVDLGLWSDLMLIAPATASSIAKMANGVADNMLITTYLSSKHRVMVAPAMDLDMWAHPSTQRNIETLKKDGVLIVEPAEGFLASGLTGRGRMEEPEVILEHVIRYFSSSDAKMDMMGKNVLITAGPTHEKIDPVRFIGNYSSGKMGFALAEECAMRGAEVNLISGPTTLQTPNSHSGKINRIDVTSAKEMLDACLKHQADADIMIMSAAVADYAPRETCDSKLKREKLPEMTITLSRNPDIAATMGKMKRDRKVIGFALETDNELENARRKLSVKNLDMVVLNSLRDPQAGFMKDSNKVTLVTRDREFPYPAKSKREVARDIIDAVLNIEE